MPIDQNRLRSALRNLHMQIQDTKTRVDPKTLLTAGPISPVEFLAISVANQMSMMMGLYDLISLFIEPDFGESNDGSEHGTN